MSLLIISGYAGSGKSLVCNTLEDMGYYCIDNLPPQLLLPVCRLQTDNPTTKNMAVVIDSRSQEMFNTFLSELDQLEKASIEYSLLFIYTESDVVLNRFKQTRRKHPLISDKTPTLEGAIEKEAELCQPIMDKADIVIDSTNLKAQQLKQTIIDTFSTGSFAGLTIKLISFGYRNGIPNEADLVFDVRCMPNPFYCEDLRNHTGLEDCVYEYVFNHPQAQEMSVKILDFVKTFLPYYVDEGKNELVIAIGCTSGHHRSVAFVKNIEEALKETNYHLVIVHRDIDKEF